MSEEEYEKQTIQMALYNLKNIIQNSQNLNNTKKLCINNYLERIKEVMLSGNML